MKARATSEWFILQNKQDIVGSILVSFEFQNSEDDILAMINKGKAFFQDVPFIPISPAEFKSPTNGK